MKKKFLMKALSVFLTLAFIGPAPALAAEVTQTEPSTQTSDISARVAEFITYYRTYNGVRQYRIWNATKAVWVTPWMNY